MVETKSPRGESTMSLLVETQRLSKNLEQMWRHWEFQKKNSDTPTDITITIGRQAGTNADELARDLGAQLNWPVYDRELLELVAQDMGAKEEALEGMDDRRSSWI